jgi:hypothetical protein
MSKLEENDIIFCSHCGIIMKEILLCIRRTPINNVNQSGLPAKQRCTQVVCEDCEYCINCQSRLQELQNELKKHKYGKKNQLPQCKWVIERLKHEYDISLEVLPL